MPHISTASLFPTVDVLGVRVAVCTVDTAAAAVATWATDDIPADGPRYVCATSVHGLIEAQNDIAFRQVLNDAALVTPDGMPLVWVGKLQGQRSMQRVYGPNLFLAVCEKSARVRARHFFYGGAAGVPESLAERMARRFPGLVVAGTYSPPFRPLTDHERDRIGERINATHPDIVWVGISTPKQERWAAEMRGRLHAKVVLTVGAAFDFHTGRVRQAPRWIQSTGLEWAFRLTQEPRRLWRRYLRNNPRFMWLAFTQLLWAQKRADRRDA